MTRPIMRRPAPIVLALLFLLILPVPTARAQELPPVELTLLSQTPWNSTTDRELVLRFRAENLGDAPLGELAIGVTLYARVLSRSAYQASLVSDPPVVIDVELLPREGMLEPGEARDFEISLTMDVFGIDPEHSGVYPLKVDLRSGLTSIAELRAPAIFLVRQPETPLALSWTFVLDHPISFAPDGTFVDASLEASLASGGRLNGQIRALLELAADPTLTSVDVAISPILLTQLGRMRDGYVVSEGEQVRVVAEGEGGAALAAQALADLRTIVATPHVRLTALPFAMPDLPSLYGGGLADDVDVQLERGRVVTASFLQAFTTTGVLRPPGAALDDTTLRGLSGAGISTLIVGPGTVTLPEQPLGFAGPATAGLGDDALTAVVPEPGADAVLAATVEDDPVLASQIVLGELAAIWQELPGEVRGVAFVLGEDAPFPGPFYTPFARGVAGAPWLAPTGIVDFVGMFPPAEASELAAPSFRRFPSSYVASLKQAQRRVDTLRSILPAESAEPDQLDSTLLLAEARQFLTAPSEGLEFVGSVRDAVQGVLDELTLETVSGVTLTSESSEGIPVTVSNGGQHTVRVAVRLVSPHLRDQPPSQDLELGPGGSETVRFPAELRSTGRFQVDVHLLSPNGRVIGRESLVVRSTAYNRIALFITIGAAVVLLGLWARRFVPRRTS